MARIEEAAPYDRLEWDPAALFNGIREVAAALDAHGRYP